jgi:DNA repair ATPase RecN
MDCKVHHGSQSAVKQQTAQLQQRLNELSAASEKLAELKRLQEELAVVGQQEVLQAECTAMEITVGNLMMRAKDSLHELHQLDEQWNGLHRKLNVAGTKINRNETDLQHMMQDEKCSTSQRRTSIQVRS